MGDRARLPPPFGTRLDRSRRFDFRFEGRAYTGYDGDVLASALAANGVWALSRSFKLHRPRGIVSMDGREANTLVHVDGVPNVLADRLPLYQGLVARGQNVIGTIERDRGAMAAALSRFLPVGFYYQAFYKPTGAWRRWEPLIRNFAGIGAPDEDAPPPPAVAHEFASCDVAIVGGGLAGIAAAIASSEAGARVMLFDDQPCLGGAQDYDPSLPDGRFAALCDAVRATKACICLRTMVTAIFADNSLIAISESSLLRVRAKRIVLATGADEQIAVFRNNDLPGVMLGSAATRLAHCYGVMPGRRAGIVAADDEGYRVALTLVQAGVEVRTLVEMRDGPADAALASRLEQAGIEILSKHGPVEARGTRSNLHVSSIVVAPLAAVGNLVRERAREIHCDLVAVSVGRSPSLSLAAQAGAMVGYDSAVQSLVVRDCPAGLAIAGAAALRGGANDALASGTEAGNGKDAAAPPAQGKGAGAPAYVFPHPKGREFVDLDEDLQIGDLLDTVAHGYAHIELVKRFSTAGMGPSQGKHSALPVLAVVASATGASPSAVGLTPARPPLFAESMATLAEPHPESFRLTPMHERHVARGANMITAGPWLRPSHYGAVADRVACAEQEALNVRNNAGMIDVSTLGGIEFRGPDAAAFLERVCAGPFADAPVGSIRYALMVDEAGVISDDGVAARLADQHFYVTATTSGVDAFLRRIRWWNTQWRMRVDLTAVTSAFAKVNVAGPDSRAIIARVCEGLDLSGAAFRFMNVRTATVAGVPARLLRIGYVGELGYEIHVPTSCGAHLWDALMETGKPKGLRPFGMDAQRLLRLEKGHFIVGRDSDAMTHPREVGMAGLARRSAAGFIAKRSIELRERVGPLRHLVGFQCERDERPRPQEGSLVMRGDIVIGRVTSTAYSPTLQRIIGLALVRGARGESTDLELKIGGTLRRVDVAKTPFYDPGHTRQLQ
jgi:sarcosine oxidase subunit alpha